VRNLILIKISKKKKLKNQNCHLEFKVNPRFPSVEEEGALDYKESIARAIVSPSRTRQVRKLIFLKQNKKFLICFKLKINSKTKSNTYQSQKDKKIISFIFIDCTLKKLNKTWKKFFIF
jgi:hypothetical protein